MNVGKEMNETSQVEISGIDENHALFGNFIGVQFVFETTLNAGRLWEAIDQLEGDIPELGMAYAARSKKILPASSGIPFYQKQSLGNAREHAQIGTIQKDRARFLSEPKRNDVFFGRSPAVSNVTLTQFAGGGSILGIAINHILVDAAGLHLVAKHLARIYSALGSGEALPTTNLSRFLGIFAYGTDRTEKETLAAVSRAGLPKPAKFTGFPGGLIRRLIISALDKPVVHDRVLVCLSAEQVARLKETVLSESGEDWISTYMALGAHFIQIMIALMHSGASKPQIIVGQLLDLRNRYFEEKPEAQAAFIGNAILIDTDVLDAGKPIQTLSRGEIAAYLKTRITRLDGAYVRGRLDLAADCTGYGYNYPGLDLKDPIIALNNQTKMPVYDIEFAGQKPVRVIPQDVGDNIMFFPTPEGGVEVYLRDVANAERNAQLNTPAWQSKIFDF